MGLWRKWADTDMNTLACGFECVLTAIIEDHKLKVAHGAGWDDYFLSADHPGNKVLQVASKPTTTSLRRDTAL